MIRLIQAISKIVIIRIFFGIAQNLGWIFITGPLETIDLAYVRMLFILKNLVTKAKWVFYLYAKLVGKLFSHSLKSITTCFVREVIALLIAIFVGIVAQDSIQRVVVCLYSLVKSVNVEVAKLFRVLFSFSSDHCIIDTFYKLVYVLRAKFT